MLQSTNSKVSPYYALITDVTNRLPAMTNNPLTSSTNVVNGSQIFIDKNGHQVKYENLSTYQKKLLHDYKIIEYDITAGNQYSAKWARQKIK